MPSATRPRRFPESKGPAMREGDRDDRMFEGSEGRFLVCERYQTEFRDGSDEVLLRWAVRPVSAYEDADEARSALEILEMDYEGAVLGVLDTTASEWVVPPEPRRWRQRWRRRRRASEG